MGKGSAAIVMGACALCSGPVDAQTIQTEGPGTAVTSIDRSATFDAINANGIPLSDYTEGGLFIGTDGDSWIGNPYPPVFDPFHGANGADRAFSFPDGGSHGWTVIRTTDGRRLYGVEFMYGNGWTTGDIYGVPWGNDAAVVEWETWRGATRVSFGVAGATHILPMGTLLGFYDPSGFDRLQVKCTIATSFDPTIQALALDNLHAQLNPCAAAAITSQPASASACAAGQATFNATAAGGGTLNYQWQRETTPNSNVFAGLYDGPTASWDGGAPGVGAIVSGAYSAALTIAADTANGRVLSAAHAIRYQCVVTCICGGVTSNAASLSLIVALPGDVNGDGVVDGGDIQPFVEILSVGWIPGPGLCAADLNPDGWIDMNDVPPFVVALLGA